MKKKFKVTLVVFLVVVLGCFSNIFAATKTNLKPDKSISGNISRNLSDSVSTDTLTSTSSIQNEGIDQYTKVLMHMDDNTFKDECGHTVTNNGVTVDSNNKKLGKGSAYFNGTNAYLNIAVNSSLNFNSNDFTIDWWEYKATANTDYYCGMINFMSGSNMVMYLGTRDSNLILYNSAGTNEGGGNFGAGVLNSWQHLALVRKSNTLYTFRNGILQSSWQISGSFSFDKLTLGYSCWDHYNKGYIDELRISNIARWTSNFTPPTSPYDVETGLTLNKTTDTLAVGQTDNLTATVAPDNATNKTVKWKSSDPSIVTVDESTGKITAVKVGTATITATTTDGSNLSSSCTVTVNDPLILNIEPEKTKINLNDTVSANLTIDNIQDIAAEDIRIKYDSTKLQFLNYEEVDGIKLVQNNVKDGELRFILASKGKGNIINAKKILLKLKFKGIAAGDALVDVTNGRVSDGITKEWDLTDEQCGQATITIQKLGDVDNSGEYTLLDLGIDARHEGEDPSTLPQYNTDQDGNKVIDDVDLTQIGKCIVENSNYAPNNIK